MIAFAYASFRIFPAQGTRMKVLCTRFSRCVRDWRKSGVGKSRQGLVQISWKLHRYRLIFVYTPFSTIRLSFRSVIMDIAWILLLLFVDWSREITCRVRKINLKLIKYRQAIFGGFVVFIAFWFCTPTEQWPSWKVYLFEFRELSWKSFIKLFYNMTFFITWRCLLAIIYYH